jgi:hypothetical protein
MDNFNKEDYKKWLSETGNWGQYPYRDKYIEALSNVETQDRLAVLLEVSDTTVSRNMIKFFYHLKNKKDCGHWKVLLLFKYGYKRCFRCKKVLKLEAYHKDKSQAQGLNQDCKECRKLRTSSTSWKTRVTCEQPTLSIEEKLLIDKLYEFSRTLSNMSPIKWSVDHIVPLSKGGIHHPTNLQLMPLIANIAKGPRYD